MDSESFNPRPTNCKKEETAAIDSTEESGKNPERIREESGKLRNLMVFGALIDPQSAAFDSFVISNE